MRPSKTYLYFICDAANQGTFYRDVNGIIQTTNIPTWLKRDPEGWLNNELKIVRSSKYFGLNRSFSVPLTFYDDGAAIIRNLFYKKKGIEQQIMIVILKWNPDNDTYYLYYKGLLDLTKIEDQVAEGVTVNVMEGGVVQLLKSYENTVFEIPCDGSIPENIKVNLDGLLFEDTFHIQLLPFTPFWGGIGTMATVFVSNDGDNIGIIHGDQSPEQAPNVSYFQNSSNYLFSSVAPVTLQIVGTVTVKSNTSVHNTDFGMFLCTSLSQTGATDLTRSWSLVPDNKKGSGSHVRLDGQQVYNFDVTIPLGANENLFLMLFNDFGGNPVTIVSGNLDIIFSSAYQGTRAWVITAYDAFRLLLKNICEIASTTDQQYNFQADSELLQEFLNLTVTSGDALRASGDASYNKFYNAIQNNLAFPNINNYFSYGPVIKLTLSDLFDSFNVVLNAALSNQELPGENESLFFENKGYVFDSSIITMAMGEVQGLKVSVAVDNIFSILKIGYPVQQYDEKGGKYEYNTTGQWQAPIKSMTKVLELITKIRFDSYGIEKTRFNTGGRSITQNDSDNSVFGINIDYSKFIYDYFKASFISPNQNPALSNNTNIVLRANFGIQTVGLNRYDGTYLTPKSDPSIFIFNQHGLSSSMPVTVNFNGNIGGKPGETITIKMWVNGVVQNTWNFTVATASTPFSVSGYTFTRTFHYLDNIYFTVDTSVFCVALIANFSLVVGSPYLNATNSAALSIPAGSGEQLVALSNQTIAPDGNSLPVVSTGFQYFLFNDILLNSDFGLTFDIAGLIQGSITENVTFYLYRNGILLASANFGGTVAQTAFSSTIGAPLTIKFAINDIVWIVASVGNLTAYVTGADLTLTSKTIKAFSLKRKQYTTLYGVPNDTVNTTDPGAPYNLEDLTPKRILLRNGNWLRPPLFNQVPGSLQFLTLDKNQFLTTDDITENTDVDISDLDDPLYLPFIFEFKTKVPIAFYQLMSYTANGHIQFTYNGIDFYGFPLEVSQVPALNDSQSWKLLCSPKTNLNNLVDLNIDGLNFLHIMPNQLYFAHLCPLKFVPLGKTLDPKYHFIHFDDDWFINQVNFWIHKSNYFQKWQLGDTIPIQCITNGLNTGSLDIYNCNGKKVATTALEPVVGTPLQSPLYQLETALNFTSLDLPAGVYYVVANSPTGSPGISEGLNIQANWAMTLLFEFTHSVNRQSMIFSTGYQPSLRVEGWIDQYMPDGKFTTFEDQPADITVIDGIPYRKFKLNIAANDGVPDWIIDKIMRIMLLDKVKIDGKQFTRDIDAKWEQKNTNAWPKRYWSLDIREAENRDGVTLGDGGTINVGVDIVYNLDTSAFGQNTGNGNVIQVTQSE